METTQIIYIKPQNNHLTIGLLLERFPGVEDGYLSLILRSLTSTVRERGVNLLCFTGGTLHHWPYNQFDRQRNLLYQLITQESVAGLIIMGSIGTYVTPEVLAEFHRRYQPLPTVSIGTPLANIPSVVVDNDRGLREAVVHLITVHHHRRIAFITGPLEVPEAKMRYRVYTEVLAEYGYPLEPDLVASGDFSTLSGAAAINLLLDQRQVSFDSVVASNDNMALGVLQALQARGIMVPHEIAVVGFDDIEGGRVSTPPLTTIRQPMFDLGKRAIELLLAQLTGETVPELVTLPTELVVRQSCGCLNPQVRQIAIPPTPITGKSAENALTLPQIIPAIGSEINLTADRLDELQKSFLADLAGESPGMFLLTLDKFLRNPKGQEPGMARWHQAISALRYLIPHTENHNLLFQAETLLHQARTIIGEMAQRVQAQQLLYREEQTSLLRAISQALVTTIEVEDLMNAINQELPRLGIESCYLSLYETCQPEDTYPQWSRIVLAYNQQGRVTLGADGHLFPSRQLAPPGLWPQSRHTMVVEPLYFRENQLGFVLFEVGPPEGLIYEVLQGQISSALQGALLVDQVQKHALNLEFANQELQAAQEQLVRQEKLAFLGQLAGGVAHELRNPLGVINNAVYFLNLVFADTDETTKEYLDLITNRVEEVEKIVSALLSLSRNRVADRAKVTASQLLDEVLARHPAPETVGVTLDLSPDLPLLFIDSQQIGQVLTNLVTNAYQAMPNGGKLTLSAQAEGEGVSLSVSDSGHGMSPETMGKIFEPLFTTKAKGIGLGLAVSKNLVELNGGKIKVESTEGQGSTFIITLPGVRNDSEHTP